MISKSAGGIGLAVTNIRAKGSYIKGSGGTSNGLTPMLRVYDNTARYVDQGGGKRKGAFAIYLEPWHADVADFLDLKKNHGKEEARARDLFYALWIPDLFMRRIEQDGEWSLFCPCEVRREEEKLGRRPVGRLCEARTRRASPLAPLPPLALALASQLSICSLALLLLRLLLLLLHVYNYPSCSSCHPLL